MNEIKKLLCLLLVAALALSLMTAAVFADKNEEAAEEPAEAAEAAETEVPETADKPDGGDPQPLVCGEGEWMRVAEGVVLCEKGGVVFSREGAVVYNNGGAVYNNGGVVYNNGGAVYNNFGIVYNNDGTTYNNSGTVYVNGGVVYANGGNVLGEGGQLVDNRILPAADGEEAEAELPEAGEAEEAAAEAEEEAAEEVPEEVDEADAVAEEVEEVAEEAEEEPAAEEEPEEGPSGEVEEESAEEDSPLAALTVAVPEFEALTAGYRRDETVSVSAAITNNGSEAVVIRTAGLKGRSSGCFLLKAVKNVTVEPGETNDAAWQITPKPNLRAGEYTAELVLVLASGESISVPFSLTVEKG